MQECAMQIARLDDQRKGVFAFFPRGREGVLGPSVYRLQLVVLHIINISHSRDESRCLEPLLPTVTLLEGLKNPIFFYNNRGLGDLVMQPCFRGIY